MPIRIQRKRTKDWRMPSNTLYVGRPSRWGNKFTIADEGSAEAAVDMERRDLDKFQCSHPVGFAWWIAPLRGKNLACWCALDKPCHADILLELANAEQEFEP